MKILFVHSIERGLSRRKPLKLGQVHHGLSYLSSVLKQHGHSTRVLVLCSERARFSLALTAQTVRQRAPDVVALTSVSSQYPFIDGIARAIRRIRPEAYLMIGGPHASLNPEECAASVYDAVCVGEGERPMDELIAQLASGQRPSDIRNMWLRRATGSVQRNPTRPFLQDLDELPYPDWDMWLPWIDDEEFFSPAIVIGRGCPYNCSYCSNHSLRRLASGKYVRFRSPENIVGEIEEVRQRYLKGDRNIYLEVEAIAIDKTWALNLCEALRRYNSTLSEPLQYRCNYRITPQSLDEEVFRALATANFRRLNIGLEAGSERVRREILKRDYSNDDFRRAIDLARRNGLEVNLYNMIGVPGETVSDHMETVRLNREARPDYSYTSIFFPYPGTELRKTCEDRGLLSGGLDVRRERKHAVLDLPEFPRRQVQRAYDLFDWRIHKGQWPVHVRLRKLVRRYIYKLGVVDCVYRTLTPAWRFVSDAFGIDRSYGRNLPG